MKFARSRAPHGNPWVRLLAGFAVLGIVLSAATSAHANIPVFQPVDLLGFVGHPTGGSTNPVQNPALWVMLNPQPLPPFPSPNTVSLIDPTDPLITNSTLLGEFQLTLAMFGTKGPGPGDPLTLVLTDPTAVEQTWDAETSDGTVLFELITTFAAPGGNAVLGGITDGTLNGLPAEQINFTVQAPVDPMASFQVFSIDPNGGINPNPYAFALTPEPGSLMLLGMGLAAVGVWRRRQA